MRSIQSMLITPPVEQTLAAVAAFERTLRGRTAQERTMLLLDTNWTTPAVRSLVREIRRLRQPQ